MTTLSVLSEMFFFWLRAACELRLVSYSSTPIVVSFWHIILCVLTCITWKLYRAYMDVLHVHIKQLLYYQGYFFSGLELHASYIWWVMAPNIHHGLFPISHIVHTYLQSLKTTGRMWTLYIKWLVYCWRHFFCGLELHERSNLRAISPDKRCSRSLIQHCVLGASIRGKYDAPATLLHCNGLHCYPGWSCIESSKAVTVSRLWSHI